MKQRILHILIALDQLAWVLVTLGKGSPDETISAASWRMEQEGKLAGRILRPLIDVFFYIVTFGRDRAHCLTAYESERTRRQLPAYYQEV